MRKLLWLLCVSGSLLGLMSGLHAQELGPVQVELRGATQTWTETYPVIETNDDAKFRTERYGDKFSYVLRGLPAGPARLKLGFCEFKHTRPGERIFDISANGAVLFDDFDILHWGEPREAVVVSSPVQVPEDGSLAIEFTSEVENAKFNWLRLYTADWSLELNADDGPELVLGKPDRKASYMHQAYETCVSKFGSRICINPRPQKSLCRQTALGHADYNVAYFERNQAFYDIPTTAVYYGVRCDAADGDLWYSLPFNGRIPAFTQIKQEQTLTRLSYVCRGPDLPVEVTYTFHAPFYPKDIKLCVAPYIMLDVTVRNLTTKKQTGTVLVGESARPTSTTRVASGRRCFGVITEMPVFGRQALQAWLADAGASAGVKSHVGSLNIPASDDQTGISQTDADGRKQLATVWSDLASGLTWDFDLGARASDTRSFAYVGWVDEPILEVMGEPQRFKYVDLFSDLYDVARFAFDDRKQIDRKTALFESTVYDASAPQELKDFLAFAFQSWMQNTFYCVNDEGKDWFSVWEGCCKFHSTVDVEYNVAPLYFEYWPELMGMTLREWVGYIRDGILSHDMGMGLKANGMVYGHDMEVEENTNFVLLLHHYWRQTGDAELVKELFEQVDALLQHVIECDTDQDGFHETGTYNTIDQGSAAVQYAKDQTYLAVRALAAFECGAQMAERVGKPELATKWRAQAALVSKTLDSEAWLDDHYVVSLNQPPKTQAIANNPGNQFGGMRGGGGPDGMGNWNQDQYNDNYNNDYNNGWSNYSSSNYQPVQGWDAYSIYASNGMLYPMRSGSGLPGLDLARIREDLYSATNATLQEFGSPHSSRENNMWVSQNIWRDMAAAYLGIDFTDNVERYMSLQKYINRDKRGCFTDVYVYGSDHISLDYYPRGTAAFGMMPAMAGLQVDKVTGRVSVAPVRDSLRIPLLAYADWSAGKVPWLTINAKGSAVKVDVEGDPGVEVTTRAFGEPW